MTTVARLSSFIFDSILELEDGAAAITASGAGSSILDLGAARVSGHIVVDVSAIDTVTGDEVYSIIAELSDSVTFASGIENVAFVQLGGTTGALGNRDVVSDVGRYVIGFQNQVDANQYRYVRLWFEVVGTSPSITCQAYLSKEKDSSR